MRGAIKLRREIKQHSAARSRLLARIETEGAARRPLLRLLAELPGIDRDDTQQALSAGLPGVGPGRSNDERLECPDGACGRVATAVPAGPVPTCWVTGRAMRRR
jgi:hypothetical protein